MNVTRKLYVNIKRLTAAFAAFVLLLTWFPAAGVFASEPLNGKCGESLSWQLDGGVLRIYGTGAMYDYDDAENPAPWRAGEIKTLVIELGVESVGAYAFYDCDGLTEVTIPQSVVSVGTCAFRSCSSLERVAVGTGVKSISDFAFAYCTGLAAVELPKSVTGIAANAFKGDSFILLYVPEGSYAESFADANGLPYETIPGSPITKGDADGDGEITVADALIALRIAADLAEETPDMIAICDVDGDAEITVADALRILRVAAKIADSF